MQGAYGERNGSCSTKIKINKTVQANKLGVNMNYKKNRYFFNGLFMIMTVTLVCVIVLGARIVSRNGAAGNTAVNTIGLYDKDNYKKLLQEAKDYNDKGNYDGAIKLLQKCEKSAVNDAGVFKEEGYAYFQEGKYEESLKEYEKALGISSKDPESRTWYAYNLMYMDDTDKALSSCNDVIKDNPQYAFAYSVRGLVLYNAGDEAGSLESLDKALALKPDDEDYYYNKVYILYKLKRYSSCINICQLAEKKFPENQDFCYYAAESCSAIGRDKDAANEYKRILKLAPRDDEVMGYLAEQYYYMEDYTKALEYVNKALDIDPSNSYALDLKSDIDEALKPQE